MSKETTIEETPFNMAMLFYMRINKLMMLRDEAATLGDIYLWFSRSKAVYRNVRFKFSDKEKKKFDDMFKEANECLSTNIGNRGLASQVQSMVMSDASKILDLIDSDLNATMHKYTMIFPKITNDGLKALDKRFKL